MKGNYKPLLIAITLILLAVLAAMTAFISYISPKVHGKTRHLMAMESLRSIRMALVSYERENGTYPGGTGDEILAKLKGANERKLHYLVLPKDGLDPWKEAYHLKPGPAGVLPVFYSSGPDRISDLGKSVSDDLYAAP